MDCRKIEAARVGGLVANMTFRSFREVRCGSLASFLARSPDIWLSPDIGGIADILQPPIGGQIQTHALQWAHSIRSSAARASRIFDSY